MNLFNKIFLKLALLPSRLYGSMGADVHQLRSIVTIKLMMDDRRPNTLQQTRRRSDKPVSMATLGTMFISLLMGLLLLISFTVGEDMITRMTIYFSFFFFMLSATLISDFTSVLIDVRDNYIILPKPVSDRTFVIARLLHIFIHLCKIIVPMLLPGLVAIAINYNVWGAIDFIFCVMLVSAFAIFIINAVYILILKFTTPQRFQSIISYVQVLFAIVIYASYQVLPRLIGSEDLFDFDVKAFSMIFLYPVYWFACTWNLLLQFNGTLTELISGIWGIVAPLLCLYIVVRYLAPSFNNKLALINQSAASPPAPQRVRKRAVYAEWLSRVFTRGHAERMGFLFTWKMSSRSRDFRIKVYPTIGYLLVYTVIVVMYSRSISLETIADQGFRGKALVISALYISGMLPAMAISQSFYSDKFRAAWIYYTAPIQKPGEIILGATKASVFKFYIPIVVLLTVTGLVIVGPVILPNIILGLFNELLIATLLVYAGNRFFPFSVQQRSNEKTGGLIRNLMVLFLSGFVALFHFFIYNSLPALILCSALSILATWLLMGSIRNTTWHAINKSYENV